MALIGSPVMGNPAMAGGPQGAANFAPSQPSLQHFLAAAAGAMARPQRTLTPQMRSRLQGMQAHQLAPFLPPQAGMYPQFSPELLRAAAY